MEAVKSLTGYAGKQHNWSLNPTTRINNKLIALLPTILILTFTINFHKSSYGLNFYSWLNANYTPLQINLWGTFGLTTVVYWVGGLIYMAMDLWEPLRSRVEKWKLQPGARVSKADYWEVCKVVARNQVAVALPLSALIGFFAPLSTTAPLPGAWYTIGTFVFCLSVEEVAFYYVHRAFHNPRIYKHVHKMHHKFTAPVALASTYCTVTEHLCSNIGPICLGIMILRSHWSMLVMFFCSLELATLQTHSGYNFPGNFSALHHDFHHCSSPPPSSPLSRAHADPSPPPPPLKTDSFTENFGPLGLLDTIHGTNTSFKAWLAELTARDSEDVIGRARRELNEVEGKAEAKREL